MAFTVETGSGLANANAYIDLAFALEHHTDRGNIVWTHAGVTDAMREPAIIRASDYIDKRFGRRFRGQRKLLGQSMEWPRLDAFDDDGFLIDASAVPRKLKMACAEYALRALVLHVLAPDAPTIVKPQDFGTDTYVREETINSGIVTQETVKVGPVSESKSYTSLQALAREIRLSMKSGGNFLVTDFFIPEYPEADLWLEELIRAPGTIDIIRG